MKVSAHFVQIFMKNILKALILFSLPVLSFLIVWKFDVGYLASIFLFYLLPAFFIGISYGAKIQWTKILMFSIVISIPFVVIVDYIGTISKIWIVPEGASILVYRFLGVLPIEDYIWFLSAVLLIVISYCSIKGNIEIEKASYPNLQLLILGSAGSLIIFGLIHAFYPQALMWSGSYSYLILGSVFFLIPGLLLSLKYRLLGVSA
ncbi:MAG: hypothetical protein JWO73_192, partial [Candidatus Taylorbacteria bacterium]|nr:hypothetical protein [Candidatus Taylorbacteria bacterium]